MDDIEQKFRSLYDSHVEAISAYAIRRVPSNAAADIVSETFLVAWRKIDSIPSDPDDLPWLYKTARYLILNKRRSILRSSKLSKKLQNAFVLSSAPAEDEAYFGEVKTVLKQMSRNDREVLQLTAWDNLKPQQIAKILDESPEAIRTRLSRARTAFVQEYELLTRHDLSVSEVSRTSGQHGSLRKGREDGE